MTATRDPTEVVATSSGGDLTQVATRPGHPTQVVATWRPDPGCAPTSTRYPTRRTGVELRQRRSFSRAELYLTARSILG